MPKFLNTLGLSCLGVGICDRCKFKFPLVDLGPDSNIPGLRVCKDCTDEYDPYRLGMNLDDRVSLEFVRPDEKLE